MKYLLDSNAVITLVMNRSTAMVARAGQCEEGDIVTSAIVIAEIAYGTAQTIPPARDQLAVFMGEVPVLEFDVRAAFAHATLPFRRASYDRLIAAHALLLGLVVVTENEGDFTDVPSLRVENWTR